MAESAGRIRYLRAMKWVRRIHLYSGLLMWPAVFLYGITGFLFNHPFFLVDHEIRNVDPKAIAGTALGDLPEPRQLAEQVIEALSQREGAPTGG